ncbi:serine/threonine-protein phosphatase 4 regulatory subunit 2 [Chrysoperla carnea]|uniref:serine/threonine-protein phosphatase 4 regulatory subunit 2 n=1 Tax=Chrysoperla carnea TaxID=189513 RepID=UPI001D061A6D|nr:serine/threonine-protein phosphatase 4 regulatory subunit 2 [Chrysoperla carnea]
MMENAEEILQCLDEFTKVKPRDIPRELEEYLCFVAKTGDPVYQWSLIKSLFREKLINVITEFYESSLSVEIPPCPNVETFNYDVMKSFILEKLESFVAAPFTVQRICELLTTPRKEYNRIDKYMRALEKNILVVSTREPGQRRSTENGDSILNGLETDSTNNTLGHDVHLEVDMDEAPIWSPKSDLHGSPTYDATKLEEYKNETNESSKEMKSIPDMASFAPHDLDLNRTPTNSGIVESVIACNSNTDDITPTEGDTTNKIFVEQTPSAPEDGIPEHTFITNISIIPAETFTNEEEKTEEKIEVANEEIESTESNIMSENNYPVCEAVLDKEVDHEEADATPTTIEVSPSIAAVLTTDSEPINKIEELEVNAEVIIPELQAQDPAIETPKPEIENAAKVEETNSKIEEKTIENEDIEKDSTIDKVDDNSLENNFTPNETLQEQNTEEKLDTLVKEVTEPPLEEMEGVEEESAPQVCIETNVENDIQKTEETAELPSDVPTEEISEQITTEKVDENTEEKPSSPPHTVEETSLEDKNVDDKSENAENSQ